MFRPSLCRMNVYRPFAAHCCPTPFSQLSIYHPRSLPPSFAVRLLSSSSPFNAVEQTSTEKKPPPFTPLDSAKRTPNVDLRPRPIKLKPSSLSTPSAQKKLPTPVKSLGEAKVTAQKDIEDAETHGILKPPRPGANWFEKTTHKLIQLAKFYYRGVKLIFTRQKEVSVIRARIKAGGAPMTWPESRFIKTQGEDISKVIPFVIIALIIEEIIPLIAIFAPFMLPSTCIFPSQLSRIQEKKSEKYLAFSQNNQLLLRQLAKKEDPQGHLSLDALRSDGASTVVCGLLGLSTLGTDALRIRRIRRHLEFIASDDSLLLQHPSPLSDVELKIALQERGIASQGLTSERNKSRLQWWLDSVNDSSAQDPVARRLLLLLSRHQG